MSTWHRLIEGDGDSECLSCGVVVDDGAMQHFTLSCPAGLCPEQADQACVFTPAPSGAECAYCGRPGRPSTDPDDEEDDDDDG